MLGFNAIAAAPIAGNVDSSVSVLGSFALASAGILSGYGSGAIRLGSVDGVSANGILVAHGAAEVGFSGVSVAAQIERLQSFGGAYAPITGAQAGSACGIQFVKGDAVRLLFLDAVTAQWGVMDAWGNRTVFQPNERTWMVELQDRTFPVQSQNRTWCVI